MAKKKTTDTPATPPRRRRTPAKPAAPPVDIAGVSGTEPTDTAADRGGVEDNGPGHDEIAEAAYHRYLKRGANDGRDFDDWLEAEQELRSRKSR